MICRSAVPEVAWALRIHEMARLKHESCVAVRFYFAVGL
jgi:hypothetical protein